ncbi:MAG: hypothetical protein MZV64_29130 [Ignavibacteriales bacterium]|nr:hypothetical protein [Ignavibacteriales bacterium]
MDVGIIIDLIIGERRFNAASLNGSIPERNGMVRIKDYWQSWIIKPIDKDMTHVILEGFVDPAGTIPDWISNFLIAGITT